ncbi:hypothetical protein H4R99_003662 [Coemansia sp. RSA 1722]|nr:hypothetical protein H4R99_003662 [Coemansia sp. RSA 1722]
MQARSTRKSLNSLLQPFKSPKRSETGSLSPTCTQEKSTVTTPTTTPKRRKLAKTPVSPSPSPSPSQPPSPSTRLGNRSTKSPIATITPYKRPHMAPLSASAGRSRRRSRLSGLVCPTDEATRLLIQEKAELQRQLVAIKEERALFERASTLKDKDEAAVVDKLIAKWQIACSSACEDLFDLLKPMMEAQRQATELGFGGSGFDSYGASGTDIYSKVGNADAVTGANSADVDSGDDGSGNRSADDANEPVSEDIDVPYMLRRLGIDPDLF